MGVFFCIRTKVVFLQNSGIWSEVCMDRVNLVTGKFETKKVNPNWVVAAEFSYWTVWG